ncbi:MAG TPA: histidine kinase [Peptococcaceae bacterium]|nr:histidine kinase [Peptococcaceae bacterium]
MRENAVREIAITNLIDFLPFEALVRLEYITMPLGALFYPMFIYNMYKNECNRNIYLAITFFSGLLILFTLVATPRIFTQFVRVYILVVLIAFTYAFLVVLRNYIKTRSSSGVVIIGCLLLLMAVINDALHVENRSLDYNTSHIYALAFLVFLFCQIYLIFINISEQYTRAKQTVETQLKLLQSQIKPHFLCNVLNNIQDLIDENPQESKRLLDELSHFLRSKFKYDSVIHDELIPVQEELGIISSFY